jgi:hypothetical protein
LTNETAAHQLNSWTELRWRLLVVTIFTLIASVCASFGSVSGWIAVAGVVAIAVLPFVGEALIQFRSSWRRLLWILAGTMSIGLTFFSRDSPYLGEWPEWIRGPIYFILPAVIEFVAASGARKHAWIWVVITPTLIGWAQYWIPPAISVTDRVWLWIQSQGFVPTAGISQLHRGTAIFGTLFLTRALVGSLIASRKSEH